MVASNPNEIRIERIYDAPVETVWDAWTDPLQVAQWWGPRGFTLTTHSKELRPGGIWHYTMHGPDGTDYPNKTLYHEVERHKKLVYDHGGNDEQAPLFRVTVVFTPLRGKTRMEMCMALKTEEEAKAIRKRIKEASGNSTWDRLAEYLSESNHGTPCFVINRSFSMPIEAVFEAWIEPKSLANWLPPAGFEMQFLQSHISVGKSAFYKLSNAAGVTFYVRMNYLDVETPHRLVYDQQFCNEQGEPAPFPGVDAFPTTLRNVIELAAEEGGDTRVTVRSEPCGEASSAELRCFVETRSEMTRGWNHSFDRLAGDA